MSRSVTRPSTSDPTPEMGAIGYAVAAGSLLLLLPLLPIIAVLWLFDRIWGGSRADRMVDRVDRR